MGDLRWCSPLLLTGVVACAPAANPDTSAAPHSDTGKPHDGSMHEGHGHHHGKDGFHKPFDDAEQWVAKFEGPERDAWQRPAVVMDAIGASAGESVADLGTGTGYLLAHLRERVGDAGSVLAVDVSESMIQYVGKRIEREGWSNVEARTVPADDPELEGKELDRVVTVNVWHHVSNREAYAARVFAGLTPGGTFFVVDFTRDSPVGPPPEHRLESSQVEAELQAAGFETRVVEADLPHQYIVAGTRP